MKRTLIAAAVLSTMAASSAYAECTAGCDPAELFTATNIYTDIGEFGFITLRGKVDVSSSNGATVNNTQNVDIGGVDMKTPPQSYTSGKVTTGIHTNDSLEQRKRQQQRLAATASRTAPRATRTKTPTPIRRPAHPAAALSPAAASQRAVAAAVSGLQLLEHACLAQTASWQQALSPDRRRPRA